MKFGFEKIEYRMMVRVTRFRVLTPSTSSEFRMTGKTGSVTHTARLKERQKNRRQDRER